MRKANILKKRILSLSLAVVLLVGTVFAIPFPSKKSAVKAASAAEWVSGNIALNAGQGQATGYDLLVNPETGITMKTGETYIFEMDFKVEQWDSGGTMATKPFGFSLLADDIAHPAGVYYKDNQVLYWSETYMSYGFSKSGESSTFRFWGGVDYHITYTVNAYDSIEVRIAENKSDGTVAVYYDQSHVWNDIVYLKNITEDSNQVFRPQLLFTNQNGTVRNINVRKTVKADGDISWKSGFTFADSDNNNQNGTVQSYSLLSDPDAGIYLSKGDTYVFEMDITQNTQWDQYTGLLMHTPFAFDLLNNSDSKTKPAGIQFMNNQVLYWINTGYWQAGAGGNYMFWVNGTYHFTYTVKAYESISVKIGDEYEATVAWEKIYGLANCSESSNTLFQPNLIFTDQTGRVQNIKVTFTHVQEAPVMGENDVNMAEEKDVPSSFEGQEDVLFPLGRVVASKDAATWNFSGVVNYNTFADELGGLNLIFGEGTKEDTRKNLTISAQIHKEDGAVKDTQLVVGTGLDGEVLHSETKEEQYELNKEYTYTVQVSEGKVCFWIDDVLLLDSFDLTEVGISDIKPKFGINGNGTSGTLSDVKVWGDLSISTRPEMGENDVNMAEGKTLPSTFAGYNSVTLDVGKLVASKENPTWYYSGEFSYNSLAGAYSGLHMIFGDGIYNGHREDLAVSARLYRSGENVLGTQLVVWSGVERNALLVQGPDICYSTNRNYMFTVKLSENKLSFWINDTLLLKEFDLGEAGVSDIRPKFGLHGNGTSGTISSYKIWGDLKQVLPAVRTASAANLADECEQFNSIVPTLNKYVYDNEKLTVESDSWNFSGKVTYHGMATYGGLNFVIGKGTYQGETREIAVTARAGGFADSENTIRNTQTVIWASYENQNPVHVGGVAGLHYETGKEYKWTVEVKEGLLTLWIDDTLIYDEVDLASYGITDLKPYFAIIADGSVATISDVEIWDEAVKDARPVFTGGDKNQAIITDVDVSKNTGKMLFDGVSCTEGGIYYYSADVSQKSRNGQVRLIVAKEGKATIEVYYDGTKVYVVKNSGDKDTEITAQEVEVDISEKCQYLLKYNNGLISVWLNDIMVLCKEEVTGSIPTAGIHANGTAGTVSGIRLWGDVSNTGSTIYQKFGDISSYRGRVNTYPQLEGYVFGGWYQDATDEKPLSEKTKTGSAYAKFVPEEVLSIKTQVQNGITQNSKSTNLRFITTTDSLQYKEIFITLRTQGKTRKFAGVDVYKSITAAKGENKITASPRKVFCEDSDYFFTVNVKNVNQFNLVWTAIPGWTTLDGTEVTGVPRQVSVNDMIGAQ